MNHTITVGGLLFGLAGLIGLVLLALSLLALFASGMSDDPEAGASAGRTGCIVMIVGLALVAGSTWGLLS